VRSRGKKKKDGLEYSQWQDEGEFLENAGGVQG